MSANDATDRYLTIMCGDFMRAMQRNVVGSAVLVKVNGVDVFKPQTGEVVSDGVEGIACWCIDAD